VFGVIYDTDEMDIIFQDSWFKRIGYYISSQKLFPIDLNALDIIFRANNSFTIDLNALNILFQGQKLSPPLI
jgi:hypothetical protein